MTVTYSLDTYRDQVRRPATHEDIPRTPADSSTRRPDRPHLGTLPPDRRMHQQWAQLQASCEILADGLEGLNDDIRQYVKAVPLASRDSGAGDAERFLEWLGQRAGVTGARRDGSPVSLGREGVEFVAVRQRLAHVRFQELLSMTDRLLPQLTVNGALRVHLNPIHVWSWFDTVVSGSDEDDGPSAVLFFPVGDEIRTTEVDADCADLIRFLERRGTLSVKDLCKLCLPGERPLVLRMLRDLAEAGMIAVG